MSGRRIRVLANDQHPDLVERESEGAQHIFTGRQAAAAGCDLRAEELAHPGDLLLDGR
jgi:hypothetical protein